MSGTTVTWRQAFVGAREDAQDTSPVVAVSPDESVLDVEFDDGYGLSAGPAVTIWTKKRVYFPVVYDGSEWLASAPRSPSTEAMKHVGGE